MLTHELRVAQEAVRQACALCRTVQTNLIADDSIDKKDKSPVTVADYGAQAIVARILHEQFPYDPIVGEEDAGTLRQPENAELKNKVVNQVQQVMPDFTESVILDAIDSGAYPGGATGRFWTLDPIDGTKGFLRKEQYAVALALIENGQVILGVLGCPNLPRDINTPYSPTGVLFTAIRGLGAKMEAIDGSDRRIISVSEVHDASQAVFSESVESGHTAQNESQQVAELLGVQAEPIRMDSQCKYGIVARGDAAIYLRLPTRKDYEEKIWDHAAGAIVIQEAGGKVTDIHGKELDFSLGRTLKNNKGVIASNGRLHDRVVEAVKMVLSS